MQRQMVQYCLEESDDKNGYEMQICADEENKSSKKFHFISESLS